MHPTRGGLVIRIRFKNKALDNLWFTILFKRPRLMLWSLAEGDDRTDPLAPRILREGYAKRTGAKGYRSATGCGESYQERFA